MPRRIGLVIYGSLESGSGGYLYDRKLVATLRERGSDVKIFSLPWRSYPRHLLDNLRGDLVARIEAARLDVLLEDELNHPSLFVVNRRLKSRVRGPLVSVVHHLRCSEHRPSWQKAFYAMIERRYLTTVDAFVFNSQTTARSVHALSGLRQPSIVAQPAGDRFDNTIDARDIQDRACVMPPLHLTFVGNVIQRKGLETLLDAVAQLPPGTWSLTVVGDLTVDPGLTRRLRRRVHTGGLAASVHFAGRLSDHEVRHVLSKSHVLAVPSTYEGFGIVYLEAMSFGLPAIGSTHGGASEIITDGVTGRLVPPGDSRALSRAVLELLQDRELLITMSLAALEHASTHRTWSQSMHTAAEFIESLV